MTRNEYKLLHSLDTIELYFFAQPVSYTHLDVYKRQVQNNDVPALRVQKVNGSDDSLSAPQPFSGYCGCTVSYTHLEGANTLSKEETTRLAARQLKFIQGLQAALIRIENKRCV